MIPVNLNNETNLILKLNVIKVRCLTSKIKTCKIEIKKSSVKLIYLQVLLVNQTTFNNELTCLNKKLLIGPFIVPSKRNWSVFICSKIFQLASFPHNIIAFL